MTTIYTHSTYLVPITLFSEDGEQISLADAEIEYVMFDSTGYSVIHEIDNENPRLTINEEDGTALVEIPASEMVVPNKVHEQIRVSFPDGRSAVVLKRGVRFSDAIQL